jgi:ABC-type branched-subunit amino acid transport system ATPase component
VERVTTGGPLLGTQPLARVRRHRGAQRRELDVRPSELFAIIGPGAGKTSLFNCLNGVYRPQAGEIVFNGG